MKTVEVLYKKDSKGRTQVWSIELEDDKYRTTEGLQNGKQTTTQWTTAVPKNVGRITATTGEDQAQREVQAKIQKQKDKGWRVTVEELDVHHNSEVMLAFPYNKEDVVGRYSQPKLDGMRCKAYRNGKLFSRNNKPIVSVPHIEEEVRKLFTHLPSDVEFLDGELYNHDLKEDFNQIISVARKQKVTPEDIEKARTLIQYHIYDLCIPKHPFAMRQNLLRQLPTLSYCELVETKLINSKEGLEELYAHYLELGYEGQMIRTDTPYEGKRTNALLKRKEFIDEEFEITNIVEGIGNRSGMMGYVVLKLNDSGETFRANARGTHDYFKELLVNKDEYIGQMATIRYQNRTPDGVPRFPVMVAIRNYE